MKNFVEGTNSIIETLENCGFTRYSDYETVWIAKTNDGYITVDNDFSVRKWYVSPGCEVTDDEFVSGMVGNAEKYEALIKKVASQDSNILYAVGFNVTQDLEDYWDMV